MKSFVLICFAITTLIACKSTKQPIENKLDSKNYFAINSPEKVKQNETILFEFINNSSKKILIYKPALKNIYKFEKGTWEKVKILYCPCGANCLSPPLTKTLEQGEYHRYSWNLIESWCIKSKNKGKYKTVQNKSKPGQYRTSISFSINGNTEVRIIKQFNIIE